VDEIGVDIGRGGTDTVSLQKVVIFINVLSVAEWKVERDLPY
jgi:hypothetical protein